ncbi:carbohydrate ABC transporter permease [uncultured Sphaerochaeta sp.]|uniref:carbohydrate ABC transporter permease n=1 Tax=uncultured Sphaerochaeta sp. TaxID=886478 RepID=UPI002A0A509B|nr:carbohydrate ABC transporter permease [uncultured Sphaerochaeta sp.]
MENSRNKKEKVKLNSFKANVALKPTVADKTFNGLVTVFLSILLFVIAIPLWSTITLSFRPNDYIGNNLQGMFLVPWKWSNSAYKALLGNNGFILAFKNSLLILAGGVTSALFLTTPLAYVLSINSLPGRKFFNILIVIPYVFNVGMIPAYLLVTNIGLIDHLAAVFIPGAISTYNCLIMRSFFEGIPNELKESARIDGATEIQVLMRIILPLSKAIIMTIGLFYGVSFWNDFFHAMLYLNSNSLQPLPILLRNILMASGMNEYVEVNAFGDAPVAAIKAASVFLSAIPMVLAYPFIQKYFTKGTLLGSVKG